MRYAENYLACCPPDDGIDWETVQENKVAAVYDEADELAIAMKADGNLAEVVRQIVNAVHDRLSNVQGELLWNDRDTLDAFRELAIRLDGAVTDYARDAV